MIAPDAAIGQTAGVGDMTRRTMETGERAGQAYPPGPLRGTYSAAAIPRIS
jgi:hypothetical protein